MESFILSTGILHPLKLMEDFLAGPGHEHNNRLTYKELEEIKIKSNVLSYIPLHCFPVQLHQIALPWVGRV